MAPKMKARTSPPTMVAMSGVASCMGGSLSRRWPRPYIAACTLVALMSGKPLKVGDDARGMQANSDTFCIYDTGLRITSGAAGRQHREEILPVTLELVLAHTADRTQFVFVRRQRAQHRQQGRVVENDIGGYAVLLGQFRANTTQFAPQRLLDLLDAERPTRGRRRRPCTAAPLGRPRILAQPHLALALQHRATGR